MKRRLSVAISTIGNPKIVFMVRGRRSPPRGAFGCRASDGAPARAAVVGRVP